MTPKRMSAERISNRGALELSRFFQSAKEVAPKLGIKPSQLSLLLAGKRMPSIQVAAAIEREFGVSASRWCDEVTIIDKPDRGPQETPDR